MKADTPCRGRMIAAAVCNFLIFAFTVYGMSRFFTVGGDGNMPVMNTRCFQYFTVDSNLLAALASLLLLAYQLRCLGKGEAAPKALIALKYVGTVAVSVTFFTVFCFLGLIYGYRSMIEGVNLFMHLIAPLLAMLSFCVLEREPALRFRSVFLGLIPTAVYGIVYMGMVVALRRWYDFYGFNMGGHWALSSILMLLGTWVLSLALWALRRALAGRKAPEKAEISK